MVTAFTMRLKCVRAAVCSRYNSSFVTSAAQLCRFQRPPAVGGPSAAPWLDGTTRRASAVTESADQPITARRRPRSRAVTRRGMQRRHQGGSWAVGADPDASTAGRLIVSVFRPSAPPGCLVRSALSTAEYRAGPHVSRVIEESGIEMVIGRTCCVHDK